MKSVEKAFPTDQASEHFLGLRVFGALLVGVLITGAVFGVGGKIWAQDQSSSDPEAGAEEVETTEITDEPEDDLEEIDLDNINFDEIGVESDEEMSDGDEEWDGDWGDLLEDDLDLDDLEDEGGLTQWRGGDTEHTGWFDITVGGAQVSGNSSEFRRRFGVPDGLIGGASSFYWEQYVGDNGQFSIAGRGLFGNHDYDLTLEYLDFEKGSIRAGYREFRTWYNDGGGFYPPRDSWFPLDRELFVDRREAWFEGHLTLEDWPELRIRYSRQFRDGTMDSLLWAPANLADARGISPSFRGLDEDRNVISLDATHNFGNTDVGLGFRYEGGDQNNRVYERHNPDAADESRVTQTDQVDTSLFNTHGFTETRFNDEWMLTTGYSYTTLDTDIGGSRIFGAIYDPLYDPALARGNGYLGLTGGGQLEQHVLMVNLLHLPWEHLSIVPSIRLERQDLGGRSTWQDTPGGVGIFQQATSEQSFVDVSERLEARYTGWNRWVVYARGEWLQGDGALWERQVALTSGNVDLFRDSDFSRLNQKYTAGANWYPGGKFNAGFQYYHKQRNSDYEHSADSTSNLGGNRFPAYLRDQDFATDDVNLRLTWRARNNLTLVSRYDYQQSQVDSRVDQLRSLETADLTTHVLSQSLSWNPWSRLYLLGSVSYVVDTTRSPANGDTAPANLLLESENDYWTASASVGYALSQKTDIEAQYTYFRADNYVDNSAVSLPYGAGAEDHGITMRLIRRIKENLRLLLTYGYYTHDDETYGGNLDYDAHLVSSTLQYRF
jgi:hypothetical protein